MAMAIFSSVQSWAGPDQGLQVFGTCDQVRGQQAAKAEELYGERFSEYARWNAGLARDAAARDYSFYRLLTTKLKILDEGEFGEAVFVVADVERSESR